MKGVQEMNRLMIVLAGIAVIAGCATSDCGVRESGTTFAYDALKPYVDDGRLPGAVSVFYDDGVQETCCIGYADVAAKRPITMDDCYMQCSQTKGFCGVTVAKLVEEGKISLDDPVSRYLPEFAELWVSAGETNGVRTLRKAKNVLTVRMCLNHTGGFPFESSVKTHQVSVGGKDVRVVGGGWTGGCPIRQTAMVAAKSPLLFEPGTKVQYSNTGIDIGAAVVEVVTGMRWEDYLQQTVLDPLGMKATTFWPTDEQLETQIQMYEPLKDAPARYKEFANWEQRPYNDRTRVFASAGAGLWTTANDQLKFYKMLMNLGLGDNGVRILKEETVRNLLAVSSRPAGMGGYSLGLSAPEKDGPDQWFGHGGAWDTSCQVNWHRRQLKLWAVQLWGGVDGARVWNGPARDAAPKAFFKRAVDSSGVNAYTGRVK